MTETNDNGFEGWAIVELMGHRRLAGKCSQETIAGAPMLRLDIPAADGSGAFATQFYGGAAIYCLTPTTEEMARAVAKSSQPAPVQRWEIPDLRQRDEASPPRSPIPDRTVCIICSAKSIGIYCPEHAAEKAEERELLRLYRRCSSREQRIILDTAREFHP
jgi:hypothetical protein